MGSTRPMGRSDPVGEQLAGWGTVAMLETRGRFSGSAIRTPVGFVEEADGALLVAAGDPQAAWALNLLAEPRCRATVGEHSADFAAEELEGRERNAAITALIVRYGTPAERLGTGPAFRLHPIEMTARPGES